MCVQAAGAGRAAARAGSIGPNGAQSVRLDVSRDGAVWETGVVYTSATSGLDAGTTRSASLEASCFNISAVTSRYVRLFLGAGATAGYGAATCTAAGHIYC